MTFRDTTGLAFRNLRQAKLRTALTTLGVSIGIASLAGMVSLGLGLQEQLVGRFLQSGVFDSITVTSTNSAFAGFGAGGGRGRGGRAGGAASQPRPLDDEAIRQIAALDHVREVYPSLQVPFEVSIDDFSQTITAAGVPMSSRNEGAFQTFAHGDFFPNEAEHFCMLSLDIAKRINSENPGALVGRNLTLSYAASDDAAGESGPLAAFQIRRVDLQCPVTGVVERQPGGFPGAGPTVSGLMVPLAMARRINAEVVTNTQALLRDSGRPRSYQTLTVRVDQAQSTQDVQDGIRGLGFSAFSMNDALRGAKSAFIVLDIFLSLIGSIALAVSSLGIVNTMVMSILERTREIGIMKAIGADNSDIRRIFLIEASVIGLFGGVLGIAIGWVVGQAINFAANLYLQSQGGEPGTLFFLPWWLIVSAIAFSMLVSLAAGSYPASRAARLDPIQALRHD
jgi:putative ABC transport system permease protein